MLRKITIEEWKSYEDEYQCLLTFSTVAEEADKSILCTVVTIMMSLLIPRLRFCQMHLRNLIIAEVQVALLGHLWPQF